MPKARISYLCTNYLVLGNVALGGTAEDRTQYVASATSLDAYLTDLSKGSGHVEAVADRIAAVTNAMRSVIDQSDEAGDAVTADLFTGVARDLDKQLWFIEAHLQKA